MGWSEPAAPAYPASARVTPTRMCTPRGCLASHTSKRVGQFGKPQSQSSRGSGCPAAPACRCPRGSARRRKPSCPQTRCSWRGRGGRRCPPCASAAICSSRPAGGTLPARRAVLQHFHRRRHPGVRHKTKEPQPRENPARWCGAGPCAAPSAGPGLGTRHARGPPASPARPVPVCGRAQPGLYVSWPSMSLTPGFRLVRIGD